MEHSSCKKKARRLFTTVKAVVARGVVVTVVNMEGKRAPLQFADFQKHGASSNQCSRL